jgi:hypothetical protein
MKCIRASEKENCKRCVAAGIDCVTYARRSGRPPGSGKKAKAKESTAGTGDPHTSSSVPLLSITDGSTSVAVNQTVSIPSPSPLFNSHTWTFFDQQQDQSAYTEASSSCLPFNLATTVEPPAADALGSLPAMPLPASGQLNAGIMASSQTLPLMEGVSPNTSNQPGPDGLTVSQKQHQAGSLTTASCDHLLLVLR